MARCRKESLARLVGTIASVGGSLTLAWSVSASASTGVPTYRVRTIDPPAPQAHPSEDDQPFGAQMDVVPDVNRDRVRDVLVAEPSFAQTGHHGVGRVYIFSGKTRRLLRTIDHPEPQDDANFGFWSAGAGVIGGHPRVAIAALGQTVNGNAGQGRVYVFDADTGRLQFTIDDPVPQTGANFGRTLISPGDLNGDGRPDIVVGASRQNEGSLMRAGAAWAFDGRNGALIYKVFNPEPGADARLGQAIADPGDINHDGIDDYMLGEHRFNEGPTLNNAGRAVIVDGKTGRVMRTIKNPEPQAQTFFGFMDGARGAPGDVTRDGVPDVFVPAFTKDVGGFVEAGRGYLFNGGTGALLRHLDDPTLELGGDFGYAYARAGDLNHDRRPDLLVGQDPHTNPAGPNQGGAYVFSGRNGRAIERFDVTSQRGAMLGAALAAPGDVNRDAHPDYFVGAPGYTPDGTVHAGRVFVLVSRDRTRPSRPRVRGPRRTRRHRPTYRFRARDRDNSLSELRWRCAVDSTRLRRCRRVFRRRLSTGRHVLRVRALDPAGNRSRLARVVIRIV